jgi:hypothetical protein
MFMLARLFRRYLSLLLIVGIGCMPLYPIVANAAVGPGQALSNLIGGADISTTNAGYYSTEARNAFVAGGFSIHFPTDNFQLINIQPPSFNAGCSGISMFFGGFSFISGAQFSQLVQNIMQAAIGYAIQLAIQTLCPACEAVLQVLQKAAQMANALGNNTCRLAKDGVDDLAGALGIGAGSKSTIPDIEQDITSGKSSECANIKASMGDGSGFLSSLNSGICQFAANAYSGIESILNQHSGASQQVMANKLKNSLGNTTYQALHAMGIQTNAATDILMTLVGTTVDGEPPSGGQSPVQMFPPLSPPMKGGTLTPIVYLYTCGDQPNPGKALGNGGEAAGFVQNVDEFCANLAGKAGIGNMLSEIQKYSLYYCSRTEPGSNYTSLPPGLQACTNVKTGPVQDVMDGTDGPGWSSSSQNGFLVDIDNYLMTAINDVQTGKALGTKAIKLIQAVPFPLYQIIDLAAVYPDVATQLLSNASDVIALMLTEKMIIQVTHALSQTNTIAKNLSGSDAVLRAESDIQKSQDAITQRILLANNLELQMYSEVRQVNRMVQNQVMQEGLMGNEAYAAGLMGNLTMQAPGSGR